MSGFEPVASLSHDVGAATIDSVGFVGAVGRLAEADAVVERGVVGRDDGLLPFSSSAFLAAAAAAATAAACWAFWRCVGRALAEAGACDACATCPEAVFEPVTCGLDAIRIAAVAVSAARGTLLSLSLSDARLEPPPWRFASLRSLRARCASFLSAIFRFFIAFSSSFKS